jgi:DNA-binding NarL/FixJ family response regulator
MARPGFSPYAAGQMEALVRVPTSPSVVIIDADRRIRQSLSDVLRLAGGVEVLGSAGDVRAALELMERHQPDVVVVDPRLPDVPAGVALLSGIRLAWPETRIVLTGWVGAESALPGPDLAFVAKSAPAEEFVAAVVEACCTI